MPGIGPSRNRQQEQSQVYGGTYKLAQYGDPGQPALPDIIPYPSSDAYKPYTVYNARDYRISGMSAISEENKNTLIIGLIVGIPLALVIWHGIKNKPRGY